MNDGISQTSRQSASLLETWLADRLTDGAEIWLREKCQVLEDDQAFYLAFALAPRKLGKSDLNLSPDELEAAKACCEGWQPRLWSVDQAARVLLILTASSDFAIFQGRLRKLFSTGDMGELVTLYQALALFPNPVSFTAQAAEGLRSNIKAVFEAVAHGNPFPAAHFSEEQWNQMVLKALFIDSTLQPIQGFDQRANAELARILVDYAHERWAAGRAVSPELWRGVGPFVDENNLDDLKRAYGTSDPTEKEGVGLALAASSSAVAQALLAEDEALAQRIHSGEVTWESVHRALTVA